MSPRVTTVIFDMFGTLVPNETEQWLEVFEGIARDQRLGVAAPALWAAWKKHEVGFREARLNLQDFSRSPPFKSYTDAWSESFALAFHGLGLRGDIPRAVDACLASLGSRDPYPDTQQALEALRGRFRVGLLSNADDNYLKPVIARNRFSFEAVLSSEASGTYKPDPRLFSETAALLRTDPSACVYVGDRQFEDVLGARLAGMRCVWINRIDASLMPDLPTPDSTVSLLTALPGAIAALERAPAVAKPAGGHAAGSNGRWG